MPVSIRVLALAVTVAIASLAAPGMTALAQQQSQTDAQEQSETDDDPVVARVNGYEIRASEVALAADDLVSHLTEIPPAHRYPFLVEYLIERHLLAQVAVRANIIESESYKARLRYYRAKAMRDAYFEDKIKPQVSEEDVRATYDEEVKKVEGTEEVRARHILVGSREEAAALHEQLKSGADFAQLAAQHSTDRTSANGGDLGYFDREDMVPAFSEVAFALKPGEISEPVQTEFGWHIIKVEDRRLNQAQPYEAVKQGIQRLLLRKKVQELVSQLRDTSEIEVVDPDLQKLRQQAPEQEQ